MTQTLSTCVPMDEDTYQELLTWMKKSDDDITAEDMKTFVQEFFTLARIFYEARAEVGNNFSRLVDNYQTAQELVGKT